LPQGDPFLFAGTRPGREVYPTKWNEGGSPGGGA